MARKYSQNRIGSDATIFAAIVRLNECAEKILLVQDPDDRVVATITDGDIRRAILSGKSWDSPAIDIAQKDFLFLREGQNKEKVIEAAGIRGIAILPVLNESGQVIDLWKFSELLSIDDGQNHSKAALIMAGGKGTRLMPLTESIPKPLVKIGGKTMLEIVIENLKSYGYKKIFLSLNHMSEQIIDYLGNGRRFGIDAEYLIEDSPLGTAGSLSLLLDKDYGNEILVTNCDVIHDIDLNKIYQEHCRSEADLTIASIFHKVTVPFGVLSVDKDGCVSDVIEKPAYTFEVSCGVYVIGKEVIDSIKTGTHLDMTELITEQISTGGAVRSFTSQGNWADLGTVASLEYAEQILSQ